MSRSARQTVIGLAALGAALAVIAAVAASGNRAQGLRADVLSARRAEPGAAVAVTVSVRDTQGVATAVEVDFGDGNQARPAVPACGPGGGGPASQFFDLEHRYAQAGVYTIVARVSSGCTAPVESVEAVRTVQVKPLRR